MENPYTWMLLHVTITPGECHRLSIAVVNEIELCRISEMPVIICCYMYLLIFLSYDAH